VWRPIIVLLIVAGPVYADRLEGHGGPIMDIAVNGELTLTASFDYSVGLWREGEPTWLEGHDAAVNAVAFLPGGRAASASDDFDIIIWELDSRTISHRLQGHRGKVMDVAVSSNGVTLASASWDGTVRLWNLDSGATVAVLDDHEGAVNALAWDDSRLFSAAADGTVIERDHDGTPRRTLVRHGFGINRILVSEGRLIYGAVDGGTRVVDLASGAEIADLSADRRPILALAEAPGLVAVGDGEGYILVVETEGWTILRDFRAALHGPIWALAFTENGKSLIAAGLDDFAAIWPIAGEGPVLTAESRPFHTSPAEVGNGERQFLRKCSVCHTLSPDGARRAGPTLYGLFGREAGSVDGYAYSPALEGSDLVWTAVTIDRLFDLGPDHYTPGSKMPMQRIVSSEDRADLIAFLERETKAEGGKK
jgi:cytochrome c